MISEKQFQNHDRPHYSLEKSLTVFHTLVSEKFSLPQQEKINQAVDLMAELHADQKDRPDGKPYASHPLEVADKIIQRFHITDPDIIVAALLHDAVEDQSEKLAKKTKTTPIDQTEASFDTLRILFNERVKYLVSQLTNPNFDEELETLQKQGIIKTKNELYREHIAKIISDPAICIIKYADFASNALALQNIPDSERKEKLLQKYGPVIKEVFLPFFHTLPPEHQLYPYQKQIIQELEDIYAKQYVHQQKSHR